MPKTTIAAADMYECTHSNLTTVLNNTFKQFDVIGSRLTTKAVDRVESVRRIMDDERVNVVDIYDIWKNLTDNVSSNAKRLADTIKRKTADKVNAYYAYQGWIIPAVLMGIVFWVVLLQCCGLFCGIQGFWPNTAPILRDTYSDNGSILLMRAVAVIFMFSSILMLATTAMFLSGVLFRRAVSDPLEEDSLNTMEKLVDTPGGMFYNKFPTFKYWNVTGILSSPLDRIKSA
ncbi:hypothetical protein LSAT2_024941 [Lamellibrachia satsuma]|nr:hypothetical protein LSAT2_024941 [Lamellibrachia satsuma]